MIYFWGANYEVLGTAPIPMCVGTVPQVLFAPYFPTKILLEHASVFLRGRGRAGRREAGHVREAHSNTYFWIYRACYEGSADNFLGAILSI